MFATLSIFLCVLVLSMEARVIMVQDTPLTSQGISLKISLKETKDASGHPVASIRLYMDDEKPVPPVRAIDDNLLEEGPSEFIPSFDDRNGFKGNGRCPLGTVWRGVRCWPLSN